MSMTITKLHDHVGAEIGNIDLTRPLEAATFATIENAFYENSVLVFRSQDLLPEAHIAFSRRFGPLEVHILHQYQLANHPEILLLSNKTDVEGNPIGLVEAGRYWHTDVSFTEAPSMGSFLFAVEIPPEGGDTLFASQFAAYDALTEDWKTRLDGLKARHGLNKTTAPKFTDAQLALVKGVDHPLIRTHPKTGRKALYAGVFVDKICGTIAAFSTMRHRSMRSTSGTCTVQPWKGSDRSKTSVVGAWQPLQRTRRRHHQESAGANPFRPTERRRSASPPFVDEGRTSDRRQPLRR